jgi:transposase
MREFLFERGAAEPDAASDPPLPAPGKPRLRVPQRRQREYREASLDELLDPEHRVRLVWAMVTGLDLSAWLTKIKAVEGEVGRAATTPQLLVALWVYATLEGVGSARELARLCQERLPYQWLCGGVSVNYHLLADSRSRHAAEWDALLTQIVGNLLDQGLVKMKRIAQDGMRVRANAGKSSFRRKATLAEHLAQAKQQVQTLRTLAEQAPAKLTKRSQKAQERAAREREARIAAALANCQQLQQQREIREKSSGEKAQEARASTTDPDARVMQFSDHGFRPGVNVQYATDVASGILVGVAVVNQGSDAQQLPPLLQQLAQRYDVPVEEALVDGGYASKDAIVQAAQRQCAVYAPLKEEQQQLAAGGDPYQKKPGDPPAVAAWRARMGTAAAKEIYRLRGQTAEWVNALARNRGLWQMPVRGLAKCRTIAVLYAIAHNLWHARPAT